ncbi:MAG: hypothetical protein AAF351_05595 [Pseudomonadota bacterium]
MFSNRLTSFLRISVFAALLAVAACQTAPVQEMSDARQAIEVAREAGAEEHAEGILEVALVHLNKAEESLGMRRYEDARVDALLAKSSALEALQLAQAATEETQD